MKKKIIQIILAISFIGSINLSAQIQQANIFFEQFKYSKAAPLYKKATTSKDEKIRKEATVRLADCYRLMNNATEASEWYNKAIAFEGVDPENYYYLGTSLRSLAKYSEAEIAFNSYAHMKPSDSRGKTYAQYCRDIKEWKDLAPCAEVKYAQELNSPYSDFGPIFYKDGLIFTSDRDIDMMADKNYLWTSFGYLDLYSSQPKSNNDFWGNLTNPVKMPNTFNQSYHNGPASFTSDYSEIFITRTLKNSTKRDSLNMRTNLLKIFCAKLNDGARVDYIPFPYNNEDYSVGHPTVAADGKKLIFSSDKPGGFGEGDLYISEWVNGKWNEPVNLGSMVNTFGDEVFPFLANDSTLYFSSDGHPGFGGLDIYETKLVNGKWTTPWNLKLPINSTYDDFSIVFSKKLTDGFFSSNRPGGKGSDDIYAFKNYKQTPAVLIQPKPVIPEKIIAKIEGYVKDKKTLVPLDSVTVFLLNTTSNEVLILKTNAEGYFGTPAEKGVKYIAKGIKTNYFDDCLSFSIPNEVTSADINIPRDLLLDNYAVNKVFKIDNIYYDLDKWDIRDDAKPSLDKLVSILTQYPINVEIGSHTDCRASSAYNNSLSQKRAESAVKYLVSSGIESNRLSYKGYGETTLVNKCADGIPCTETEHQANRRTEFKITGINSTILNKRAFNPNTFQAGDKIPIQSLDADFFNGCLDNKSNAEISRPEPEPIKQQLLQEEGRKSPLTEAKTPELASVADSSLKSGFTVQVAASIRPIPVTASNFKGESSIQERKIGAYYKYFTGSFTTFTLALEAKNRLIAKFPGAFVVSNKNLENNLLGEVKN